MERCKLNKFCDNCGSPLDPESQFCAQCGAITEDDEFQSTFPSKLDISNTFGLKLGIYISSAVLILSSFLPYISINLLGFTQSRSLIEGGDGFIFIAFAIAAILAAALKPRLSFAFGILSLCLCLFELVNTFSNLGEYATFVNKGMGCYLSLISAIALIIFCALFFFSARKRR